MFSAREIIEIAVRLEKNAENYYRKALEGTSTPSLREILLFLADQEHVHAQWFAELKEGAKVSIEDREVEEITGALLQNLIGDQKFSLSEVDLSLVENQERVVELAIEFEKDTILFYEMLQSFIDDDNSVAVLDKIIAEENRHVELLKGYASEKRLEA